MQSNEWVKIKEVFNQVLDLPESEHGKFLANYEDFVRSEVVELIKSHQKAQNFIAESVAVELGITQDSLLGKQIDDYKIIEQIGAGGMGTVYLAERINPEQKVAVKLIKRGMDTTAVLKRFIIERQILAQLEHPNIARLIDAGSTEDGLPYFVMEYIEGETITKFCDHNELDIKSRLELFKQVCSAVNYAHQNLIVHRDLKPSNILITKDSVPKLLDFGIAKLLSPDWNTDTTEATATMARMFTPEYASPEHLRGKSTTTATDVYSLGIVLYELLTGTRPFNFTTNDPSEIAEAVSKREPISPSSIVSEEATVRNKNPQTEVLQVNPKFKIQNPKSLKGDLDNIVLKAIRREPERRYQSVQEFYDDIHRYLVGLPVKATADSSFYRLGKFIKRHRTIVLTTVFVALLLITSTSITGWQYFVAQRERAKAEQRFNDVRKLANSVVFDFDKSIENLPGSTPSRELLVSSALEYLDKLAADAGQDNSLQMELADAYDKIGDIQGGLFKSHVGQRGKAKESYQKALAIRELLISSEPDNTNFLRKLAISYTKMGEILWVETDLEGTIENAHKAFNTNQKIAERLVNDTDFQLDYAMIYSNLGQLLCTKGNLDEGIKHMQKAVQMMEELALANPNNKKVQQGLALSYDHIAGFNLNLKQDFSAALIFYRKSQAISEKLFISDPQNTNLKRGVAVSYYDIANTLESLNDNQTALENSQKALTIFKEMLSADPQNEEFKQIVAAVETQVSGLLVKTGKADEAIKNLKESLEALEKLIAASPNDQIARFRIAIVYENLGKGYAALASGKKTSESDRLENWREARSDFQKSFETYKSFRDAGKIVGEEAAEVDKIAEEIAKCDAAITRITGK